MNIPTHQTISEAEAAGFEVEISYSEQEIADKLVRYGLVQSVLFNQLKTDEKQLKIVVNSHQIDSNPLLASIKNTLLACPSKQNLSVFTAYINQLIFVWLSAVQHSANIQIIFNLISCLESKSLLSNANTPKLHLFLFHLMAETSHQLQQQQ